jgi:hypothetical protein
VAPGSPSSWLSLRALHITSSANFVTVPGECMYGTMPEHGIIIGLSISSGDAVELGLVDELNCPSLGRVVSPSEGQFLSFQPRGRQHS